MVPLTLSPYKNQNLHNNFTSKERSQIGYAEYAHPMACPLFANQLTLFSSKYFFTFPLSQICEKQ